MKYLLYIVILFVSLTYTGCYDLDRFPQQQLSPSTFWKTETHAKQAINACYTALRNNELYNTFFGMDCLSDIGFGYDAKGYWDISRGTWTSRTSIVLNRWKDTYDGVRRTNDVIRNVSAMDIDVEVKNEVIGEAKFLRALFYFFLMNHFGGVPIYDESVDYNAEYMNLLNPRSTLEQTREFILEDLNDAINILPAKWPQAEYGRATRGAAHALRGKVYLYNKEYAKAIVDFEEIVLDPANRGYGYELYSEYADLFTQVGHRSSEMIFSIQTFSEIGNALGLPYAHYLGSNATLGTSWNNVMPSNDLVNMYEWKDGRPFNWDDFIPGFTESEEIRLKTLRATLTSDRKSVESYPEYHEELLEMYEQRDPRMQQTIILPYTHYMGLVGGQERMTEFVYATGVAIVNGFVVVNRYNNGTHYMYLFRKFVPRGNEGGTIPNNYRAYIPIDFPIIRYADVLLMLAECYNEEGRINDAVNYINMVRSRPSTSLPAINSGPAWLEARTKQAVFERIYQERAVEFPAEGHRYYDLKRWNLAKEVMNNRDIMDIMGGVKYTTKFEDKDYLWPIPAAEIDNNPALEQNPGWQ
ncbi:RagB/SusD family nutrient uptake outer membrane protein [Petrimonas sulfuriphila]|uniref:RagB/SusD family nutrient uptake outer membrane protein n=1 Tax=Petrimonas sulfuriphila TaxID=285070 RepID=UPI003EB74964